MGRCTGCGGWDTFDEAGGEAPALHRWSGGQPACRLNDVKADGVVRLTTGASELDRVLGGGLVAGLLVLLGGSPGIGKSTLLLQALCSLAQDHEVLYVSGEESLEQTALRAARLGLGTTALTVLAETRLGRVFEECARLRPSVLAIDSIQTMEVTGSESFAGPGPGSLAQVRAAANQLLAFAKAERVATIIVGHVTKDGALAGPKTLEHIVDAVLLFEGERGHPYRILRAVKNRFGSTDEMGVFEMGAAGLREVENPSALFLAERPVGCPGSVVVASVEGTRPLLVELQALVAPASGMPRRTALGIDPNRVSLLLAVVERRAGINVLGHDVFVNLAGGVALDEPAADLGVVAAVASSASRRPADMKTVCFGEVGLAGEVRAVTQAELRLGEAAKLGFRRAIMPAANRERIQNAHGLEIVGVSDVEAALAALLR